MTKLDDVNCQIVKAASLPEEFATLHASGRVTMSQLEEAARRLEARTGQSVKIITRAEFDALPDLQDGKKGLQGFGGITHDLVAWNDLVDKKNRQRKLRKLLKKRIVDVGGVPIVKGD